MSPTRLNLDDFPASPYAHELRHRPLRLRFRSILEDEFVRVHLDEVRARIRIWTALALLLAFGFGFKQWLADGGWSRAVAVHSLVVFPAASLLACLVWTPAYQRAYMTAARILAPLFGAGVAAVVAFAVTKGDAARLAMLTLFVMAAFFFMGLLLRAAVATSLAVLLSFTAAAWVAGMPPAMLLAGLTFVSIAAVLSAVIAWETEVASRRRFLEEALIGELVERDGLTGLKNRRAFDENLLRLWQQSLRGGGRLAMLFFDVDDFKRYNDEYGHQAGDVVLRRIARTAKEFARRPLDFAARFGGEEFAVVLYDVDERVVADIAERLRSAVERLRIEHRMSRCANVVTISVGVGIVQPVIGRTPQGLLQLCDEALYKAKAEGRNRFVIESKTEYDALVTGTYRNAEIKKLRG